MTACTCAADLDGVAHEPFCAVLAPPPPINAAAVARAIVAAGPLDAVQRISGPALMALASAFLDEAL